MVRSRGKSLELLLMVDSLTVLVKKYKSTLSSTSQPTPPNTAATASSALPTTVSETREETNSKYGAELSVTSHQMTQSVECAHKHTHAHTHTHTHTHTQQQQRSYSPSFKTLSPFFILVWVTSCYWIRTLTCCWTLLCLCGRWLVQCSQSSHHMTTPPAGNF